MDLHLLRVFNLQLITTTYRVGTDLQGRIGGWNIRHLVLRTLIRGNSKIYFTLLLFILKPTHEKCKAITMILDTMCVLHNTMTANIERCVNIRCVKLKLEAFLLYSYFLQYRMKTNPLSLIIWKHFNYHTNMTRNVIWKIEKPYIPFSRTCLYNWWQSYTCIRL